MIKNEIRTVEHSEGTEHLHKDIQQLENLISSPDSTAFESFSPQVTSSPETYNRPRRQTRPPKYLQYPSLGVPYLYPVVNTVQVPTNCLPYNQSFCYYPIQQTQYNALTMIYHHYIAKSHHLLVNMHVLSLSYVVKWLF